MNRAVPTTLSAPYKSEGIAALGTVQGNRTLQNLRIRQAPSTSWVAQRGRTRNRTPALTPIRFRGGPDTMPVDLPFRATISSAEAAPKRSSSNFAAPVLESKFRLPGQPSGDRRTRIPHLAVPIRFQRMPSPARFSLQNAGPGFRCTRFGSLPGPSGRVTIRKPYLSVRIRQQRSPARLSGYSSIKAAPGPLNRCF